MSLEETLTEAVPQAELSEVQEEEKQLHGLPVFSGVAVGTAFLFTSEDLVVPQFSIEPAQARGECQRLRMAIQTVSKQLDKLSEALDDELPQEAGAFVDVHKMILSDPALVEETIKNIKDRLVNAEWALSIQLESTRKDFDLLDNDYLRERFDDIAYVVQRVQRVLAGRRSDHSLEEERVDDKIILVTDRLDPTDMLQLRERDDLDVVGIIMEEGSATSHAAILAHSLEIPTLVGVSRAKEILNNGQTVILNADDSLVRLFPTAEEKKSARQKMRGLSQRKKELAKLKEVKSVTSDGVEVKLLANIALPNDIPDVRKAGGQGIGLFRTEFLFLNRCDLPGEDEQYAAYSKVIRAMRDKPVYIRLADLGGDKMLSKESLVKLGEESTEEFNPSLGLRGLRFLFKHEELFNTQLRAILRAAANTTARILLPMITDPEDVRKVKKLIDKARRELGAEGAKCTESVLLGGMIEVPAAVAMLPEFMDVLDFFSLGTNDLVQYTLAVDRANASVSSYYDELHPSVLRTIAKTIKTAVARNIPISVCGEMAGRPELAEFFVGLGVSSLSMDASHIPSVKKQILKLDSETAREFAKKAVRRRNAQTTRKFIEKNFEQYIEESESDDEQTQP